MADPDAQKRISFFKETAKSFPRFTDKIGDAQNTGERHRYHNMYGYFLLPLAAANPTFKFLEIGLGCDMLYGAGASIPLWKKLFPKAELWEAEYDEKCVEEALKKNQLDGIHTLVGDQGDVEVLDSWIKQSGGKFDAIIDDGGHTNCQMSHTFDRLWPEVNPGGYYFIEDMQVSRRKGHFNDCGDLKMADRVEDWVEELLFITEMKRRRYKEVTYKLPKDLIFVHCQAEACVLGKRHSEINDPYIPKLNKLKK